MISHVEALWAGNALRLYLTPPVGAVSWRVLRRTNPAAFTGPEDQGAVRVADRHTGNVVQDDTALENGFVYHYRVHYRDRAGNWIAEAAGQGTPQDSYSGDNIDAQSVLIARLEAGLKVEVKRDRLMPESGDIPVVKAPFGLVEGITFPCVSVHVQTSAPLHRGIGEILMPDESIDGTAWQESEGWLSRVVLNVVAVSLNPDERAELRQALERIVLANLPIFAGRGLDLVEFTLSDVEDEGPKANNAILFMAAGTFSCVCPSFVTHDAGVVRDVEASVSVIQPGERS